MKVIIRQFVCRVKTGESQETRCDFKAVVRGAYDSPYRIEVISHQFINGRTKSYCKSELYFDSCEEMIKDFEYHYDLCKGNLFTDYIKIIK